jgi:hypothetical protein
MTMIRILTAFILMIYASVTMAQKTSDTIKNIDYNFVLVNSLDTLKKVKLVPYYDLSYCDTITDTTISQKEITLSGRIINLDQKQITYSFSGESVDITRKHVDGRFLPHYINYYSFDNTGNENQIKLDLSKTDYYLNYSKPSWRKLYTFGWTTFDLSILTAAVIAPLISTNFKKEIFNSHRYYTTLISCGAGILISAPILLSERTRYYKLTERNKKTGKDYWYIEKNKKEK